MMFCSFSTNRNEIADCFINFDKASKLSMSDPQRLPGSADKTWEVKTEHGTVTVTRIDGYRVLYNNKKKVPFVNLKVELSEPESYGADTTNILENLNYLNTHSTNMETKDLIKLQYNGYTIYGLSRSNIEAGSILGSFVMFPGNSTIVYFDFNNLKPEFRNFENLDDYKSQRNAFIGAYTAHLKKCQE